MALNANSKLMSLRVTLSSDMKFDGSKDITEKLPGPSRWKGQFLAGTKEGAAFSLFLGNMISSEERAVSYRNRTPDGVNLSTLST